MEARFCHWIKKKGLTFFHRIVSYKVRFVRYKVTIARWKLTIQTLFLIILTLCDINLQLRVYISQLWLFNSQLASLYHAIMRRKVWIVREKVSISFIVFLLHCIDSALLPSSQTNYSLYWVWSELVKKITNLNLISLNQSNESPTNQRNYLKLKIHNQKQIISKNHVFKYCFLMFKCIIVYIFLHLSYIRFNLG